jgi:hypothetical protein
MPRGKGTPKTGGRRKGSTNKATAAQAKAVAESGLTPLDFMLKVMRDDTKPFPDRLDAAKSAAPYVHPKLAAIEHTGKGGGPMEFRDVTEAEVDDDIARLEAEIATAQAAEAGHAAGGRKD